MSTLSSFHVDLIADVFPDRLTNADSMLVFALLHTHQIRLTGPVIIDAPQTRSFEAITQRHCAECLANLWRATDDDRRHYMYWYREWNSGDWGVATGEESVGRELDRFNELKVRIESHPAMRSLVPED